jgi:hypothetical protein
VREIIDYAQLSQTTLGKTSETVHVSQILRWEFLTKSDFPHRELRAETVAMGEPAFGRFLCIAQVLLQRRPDSDYKLFVHRNSRDVR